MFKNLIPTSKKTNLICITNMSVNDAYSEEETEHTNTLCERNAELLVQ
jgi:hypothetical protein